MAVQMIPNQQKSTYFDFRKNQILKFFFIYNTFKLYFSVVRLYRTYMF